MVLVVTCSSDPHIMQLPCPHANLCCELVWSSDEAIMPTLPFYFLTHVFSTMELLGVDYSRVPKHCVSAFVKSSNIVSGSGFRFVAA